MAVMMMGNNMEGDIAKVILHLVALEDIWITNIIRIIVIILFVWLYIISIYCNNILFNFIYYLE
jgi:hypothetical protein